MNQILKEKETESSRVIGLQKKIKDLELLYQESLSVIKNLHCEIEERNAKILKLELSHNVQIVTEKNNPLLSKPRIEMTSLVSSSGSTSSSGKFIISHRARISKKFLAKKLVKSNVIKNFFRETAFLAVLNFFPSSEMDF